CTPSGKVALHSLQEAERVGRKWALKLTRLGIIVEPMFAYVCRHCDMYHLTRIRRYRGGPANPLVYSPAPVELQLWAMKPEHREQAQRRVERRMQKRRELHRLPDPTPEPLEKQPYAKRPRGLRR